MSTKFKVELYSQINSPREFSLVVYDKSAVVVYTNADRTIAEIRNSAYLEPIDELEYPIERLITREEMEEKLFTLGFKPLVNHLLYPFDDNRDFLWNKKIIKFPSKEECELAPHPELAYTLRDLASVLRGMPTAPPCSLGFVAKVLGLRGTMATFPPCFNFLVGAIRMDFSISH